MRCIGAAVAGSLWKCHVQEAGKRLAAAGLEQSQGDQLWLALQRRPADAGLLSLAGIFEHKRGETSKVIAVAPCHELLVTAVVCTSQDGSKCLAAVRALRRADQASAARQTKALLWPVLQSANRRLDC